MRHFIFFIFWVASLVLAIFVNDSRKQDTAQRCSIDPRAYECRYGNYPIKELTATEQIERFNKAL